MIFYVFLFFIAGTAATFTGWAAINFIVANNEIKRVAIQYHTQKKETLNRVIFHLNKENINEKERATLELLAKILREQ